MIDKNRLVYLLKRYLDKTCTSEEISELGHLIEQTDDDTLARVLETQFQRHTPEDLMNEEEAKAMLDRILKKDEPVRSLQVTPGVQIRSRWRRLLPYAAVLTGMLIAIGLVWKMQQKADSSSSEQHIQLAAKTDIAPGTSGAVLTLSDGKRILLDSTGAAHELLSAETDGIVQLGPGGIAYSGHSHNQGGQVAYNTLTTPTGRTFHVRLPDGTDVWLNAASSIRYPTAFENAKREVLITGEAYFEVAKLQKPGGKGRVPFIVNIQMPGERSAVSHVEVLGTHFNINAYGDDGNVKTTLLEGKVNVYARGNSQAVPISPGYQAVIGTTPGDGLKVHPVDIDKAVAWKNGYFDFDKASLKEVMQQIGRWYNVRVVYPGEVPERVFWGKIQRSLYLSQVLSVLERVDIHFKIDEHKLIVMP